MRDSRSHQYWKFENFVISQNLYELNIFWWHMFLLYFKHFDMSCLYYAKVLKVESKKQCFCEKESNPWRVKFQIFWIFSETKGGTLIFTACIFTILSPLQNDLLVIRKRSMIWSKIRFFSSDKSDIKTLFLYLVAKTIIWVVFSACFCIMYLFLNIRYLFCGVFDSFELCFLLQTAVGPGLGEDPVASTFMCLGDFLDAANCVEVF